MVRDVVIKAGTVSIAARLRDTPTADKIWSALPLYATAQTWGEEVYFNTSISSEREADARDVVEPGEIAYWPEGHVIAIGFGPTPISQGDEIRLTSPCNIWADAVDDVRALRDVHAGGDIAVVQAPNGDDSASCGHPPSGHSARSSTNRKPTP